MASNQTAWRANGRFPIVCIFPISVVVSHITASLLSNPLQAHHPLTRDTIFHHEQQLNKLLEQAFTGGRTFTPSRDRELVIVRERADGTSEVPDTPHIPPLDPATTPFQASSIHDAARNHVGGARFFGVLDRWAADRELIKLVDYDHASGEYEALIATFESAQRTLDALEQGVRTVADLRTAAANNWWLGIYGLLKTTYPELYRDEEGDLQITPASPAGSRNEE
ncbi:uncharacterized protein PG986_009730 [Apiospora aurea]|uniref:Uncharacterized protein n=1 Tax=Apiospora aurea TaxID=335848 RepID=A0ABR1Q8H9_9PEZI